MYSPLYDRLIGWLFFAVGLLGVTFGHLGSYAQISLTEGILLLGLGLIGMTAARSRTRSAVLGALVIGLLCILWAVYGTFAASGWLGSSDPLETAWRLLAGVWGLYVAAQDVMVWRNA